MKARPAHLQRMSEAAYPTHFEYGDTIPLSEYASDPGFFTTCSSNLKAGDIIGLSCYSRLPTGSREGIRLLEMATARVVESSREGVELILVPPGIVEIPEAEIVEHEEELPRQVERYIQIENARSKWNVGRKCWEVVAKDADGKDQTILSELPDKDTAEAIARGHIPVPEAA